MTAGHKTLSDGVVNSARAAPDQWRLVAMRSWHSCANALPLGVPFSFTARQASEKPCC